MCHGIGDADDQTTLPSKLSGSIPNTSLRVSSQQSH